MKRICKKLLIFLFIFTTFIGGGFASSRLPNGKKPNEELMAELRGAVRFLSCHYATCEDIESQDEARELISSVLADKKIHDHAVLAFDDVDREDVINYNKAVANGNKQMINAIQNSIIHTKTIRKQFGL